MRSTALTLAVFQLALVGCDSAAVSPPASHLRIASADAQRGRTLIETYGCNTCHRIDGIRGARGVAGPPIIDWAQRTTLAGRYPNTPRYLVAWLLDPPAMRPETAMPNQGLTASAARDVAAYLYTLGSGGANVWPPDPPLELITGDMPTIERIERTTAPLARGAGGP